MQTIKVEKADIEFTDDPVINEIDVYLAKSLANKIFILQYPMRPNDRTYDDIKILNARIKPKQSRIELEMDLNTTNDHYSRVKGEQFAINVDGNQAGLGRPTSFTKQAEQSQRVKYFRSNVMDKLVLSSANACLGQMNRLYYLGMLRNDAKGNKRSLHLTPTQGIVQMKPSLEYFDLAEKRLKETNASLYGHGQDDMTAYSTEEEIDSEADTKPELVTLKYGSNQTQASSEEQNWIRVEYVDTRDERTLRFRKALECEHGGVQLKIDISNEDWMRKSIDLS